MSLFRPLAATAACMFATTAAQSAPPGNWSQGFETDTSGWVSGAQGSSNFGAITRTTGPLVPHEGGAYAVITQGTEGSLNYAPFTLWGGYSTTFPSTSGYKTRVAIYLSPSTWTPGNGFDYTSAVASPRGGLLRDYYFHVAVQSDGQLLVGTGLKSVYEPRMNLALAAHHVVTGDGWYVFEHSFSTTPQATLAAELRLYNPSGVGVFSSTYTNPADSVATVVGGNRHGWFAFVRQPTAIDAASIPAPGSVFCIGLLGVRALRRHRRWFESLRR